MSQSKSSRREALRAQQAAQARAAKRKKLLGVIAGLVAIAVIAVIATITINNHKRSEAANMTVTSAQVTPPSADAATGTYTVNPKTAKKDAPTLTLYEDYQCPICKETEDTYGSALRQLATSGDIKLQYRTLTFLDDNYPGASSYRAAMAAASADMVGKLQAYHNTIYKNQPAREGTGYTDDQLRNAFAKDAGITGTDLTKFQKYYDTKATSNFVKLAASKGLDEGTKLAQGDPTDFPNGFGTPTWTVNGKPYTAWQSITNPTAASLLASITSAAG
ncbi:DsbA family protein [Acidipropionibacterium jensenii]|uniref:DsbA family protein n=1 Tax=Acidipropionibacterium jensenii TaxID=1749 RepID=UPI00214CD41F|nr:thioredoxin domain-containing protein [Acidipropionibacterium jensenii]